MSLKDYQKQVDEWISQYKDGYWTPLEILAHLTEEIGELAREINHRYGKKTKKDSETENTIEAEIADIIFVLICLANRENIDLDKELQKHMKEKEYGRDANRWERK